tara:strand:+ start:30 stop:239 length:210 start_codon:yes stop_codon:yes gene_type:complete
LKSEKETGSEASPPTGGDIWRATGMSAPLPVLSPNNVVATRRTTPDIHLAPVMPDLNLRKKPIIWLLKK